MAALDPVQRGGQLVLEQSAGERLLWRLDWSEWLARVGATALASASWTAAPGVTVEPAWLDGAQALVWVSGGEPGRAYWLRCEAQTDAGHRGVRELTVSLSLSLSGDGGIFGSVADGLARLRASLATVSSSVLPQDLPDAVAWQRLLAAVAEVQGALGVPLRPTLVLPEGDASPVPPGVPVMREPGYDLPPDFFAVGRFGALQLRVRPVIEVEALDVLMPGGMRYTLPARWVRLDRKYGLLHLVPDGTLASLPYGGSAAALAAGVTVPAALRVRYRAGIDVLHPDYAAVLDAVVMSATLRVLRGAVTPTSASVSADGLSQSSSIDVDRLASDLDDQIAALRLKLLGPLWGVL